MKPCTIVLTTTEEELKEVAALATKIWHQHFVPLLGEAQVDYMVEKYQSYPAMRGQIASGYRYYRMFDGDTLVGYTGVHPENGALFISKLYVQQESRGNQFASQAFRFLVELCKKEGWSKIWLTCNKHNDHTLEIYHHLGFQITDSVVTDIGCGFVMDDYILEYPISK